MSVVEEVRTLRLQFISLFLVFVSTVLIQFVDFRIGEYQSSITQKMLAASSLMQIHTAEVLNATSLVLQQFLLPFEQMSQEQRESLKKRITVFSKSPIFQDSKFADLNTKFQNGSIFLRQFYGEAATIHEEKAYEYFNKSNATALSVAIMVSRGSVWKPIKTYILFPLQIVFVCIPAIGYYKLMTTFSKRMAVDPQRR